MAIIKHLLFFVLFLAAFLLASCDPEHKRPSRPPPPRRSPPPPPRRSPPPPPRRSPPPPPRRSPPPPPPRRSPPPPPPRRSPPPPPPRQPPPPPPPPPPSPPPPPPPPPGPSPGYDYFKLALQWPNSYCRRDKQNLCNPHVPPDHFTIRGLWPLKGGERNAPTCCSTNEQLTDAVLTSLKANLLSYWPRLQSTADWERSKKLWYAQWRTHGSCSSNKFKPEEYFRKAIALAEKYRDLILSKMKEEGIKPDGSSYTSQKILKSIESATKFRADIKCSKDNSGKIQLLEIHLCVKKDGVTLQNCGQSGKAISCNSQDPIFPSAPPPPPPPPPPTPPPPPSPNAPGFDYFLLTLQWPNALCKEEGITCRPTVPRQYFTIHGLWPQRDKASSPENCVAKEQMTDAILEEFQCELLEYWPRLYSADDFDKSKKFWIEEWDKHGTCSSNKFPPEAYLQATIDLGRVLGPLILSKMKEKGIEPDGTTPRTAKTILSAIKDATNKAALIRCTTDARGNLQLSDIRLCVAADGKTLEDCKNTNPGGNCDKEFIFPSAPSTTPARFPSFVSSIMEEAVGL